MYAKSSNSQSQPLGCPRVFEGGRAESAQRALESLRSSKVAVLAIYVYDRVVWGFAPGQESWACRRVAQEQSLEFAHRTRREASDWIKVFPRHEVLFILEFTTQDAAAEAKGHSGLFDDAG